MVEPLTNPEQSTCRVEITDAMVRAAYDTYYRLTNETEEPRPLRPECMRAALHAALDARGC